jgi:4-amino-4-deoxy-L-arabinose transferase-like glycosyltransferase
MMLVHVPMGRRKKADPLLLGLLIMAFSVRLVAALIIPVDFRFRADAVKYVFLARQLLATGVYGLEPGIPDARVPPGYPLFVAGVFALTDQSMMMVRFGQVVLGTVMVWLTFLIGREIRDRRTGLLAALIIAVYPAWIYWNLLFLSETLFTFLLLAFAWLLLRSMKNPTAQYGAATGVVFALALFTREVLYMFPVLLPLFPWWSRVPWRRAWRYLFVFVIALLLTLSPWLVRNHSAFGHVFYTEGSEATRYRLAGSGYLSPFFQYLADESITPPPDKSDEYLERYGKASDMIRVSHIITAPRTYMRHLVNRAVELWLHPNGLVSLPDILVVRTVYIAVHLALLGLAGVGIVVGLRRRDVSAGVLTLILVYFTGTSLFFSNPHPRYTLPVLPLIFALAAFAVNSALERIGFSRFQNAPERKGARS